MRISWSEGAPVAKLTSEFESKYGLSSKNSLGHSQPIDEAFFSSNDADRMLPAPFLLKFDASAIPMILQDPLNLYIER